MPAQQLAFFPFSRIYLTFAGLLLETQSLPSNSGSQFAAHILKVFESQAILMKLLLVGARVMWDIQFILCLKYWLVMAKMCPFRVGRGAGSSSVKNHQHEIWLHLPLCHCIATEIHCLSSASSQKIFFFFTFLASTFCGNMPAFMSFSAADGQQKRLQYVISLI